MSRTDPSHDLHHAVRSPDTKPGRGPFDVWAPHRSPMSSESHCVKLVAFSAEGSICTRPR